MKAHVILNSVISIDGKVGDGDIALSDKLEENRLNMLKGSVDAIMLDAKVLKENPQLIEMKDVEKEGEEEAEDGAKRRVDRYEKPYFIVVDKDALTSSILGNIDEKKKVFVAITSGAHKNRVKHLNKLDNVEVVRMGEYAVNLENLVWTLASRGIKTILLEGSGTLVNRMVNGGLIDEMYVSISPVLMGNGEDMIEGKLEKPVDLTLDGIMQFGDRVVLHYAVKKTTID
jgi:2,5-diamino-6-(ribosylamino)-4(3H)-pyrimidinone 5'-phosphate reductase